MNKNDSQIIQKATWKKVVLFTVLAVFFLILINYSSIGVAGLLKITDGANILDFEFGYNQEEAYQMLTALGTDGRLFYLTTLLPLDVLFPFASMLFFAGWIALLIKYTSGKYWYKYLLLIPILAMLFDWMENVGIIAMLISYPDLPAWAVYLASISGMLKTIFIAGNIIVIGLLLIMFLVKKTRKKQ